MEEKEYTTLELTKDEVKLIYEALNTYEDGVLDGPCDDEYKKLVTSTREIFESHFLYYYEEDV